MSKSFFSKLNYSLANEDTSLEYNLVQSLKPRKTLAVCGSGGRSLPLIHGTSEKLVCVDLAHQQLLLARHRMAAILGLDWRDYRLYWGFPPYRTTENRKVREQIFEALSLDKDSRRYFSRLYDELAYEGLIYQGKWEKTFTGIPKLLRKFVGTHYDEIFAFKSMREQKKYFDKELKSQKWALVPRLVLRAFGNAAFFNAFLYKGHFVKKNVPESHFEYYRQAYRRLFYQDLTRTSFFLQLTFLGNLRHEEGNPIEARQDVFDGMREDLKNVPVELVEGDLFQHIEKSNDKFDFVSLSDVPSYFSAKQDKVYLQRLTKGLNPGALVVVRCYLKVPELTDLLGFRDRTSDFKALIDAEKTQIYYVFIYEYEG